MDHDVVFLHGLFMNPTSWAGWVEWFSGRGFRCHTLAWPGHDGEPAALRAAPPEILAELTLGDVVETHRRFLDTLPRKPILIGHSLGGLIAQRLLSEDRALAVVALDPAPPKGIFALKWSFLKCNLPVINPLAGNRPFQPGLRWFHYAFCNTITLDETRDVFEAYVVPGRAMWREERPDPTARSTSPGRTRRCSSSAVSATTSFRGN